MRHLHAQVHAKALAAVIVLCIGCAPGTHQGLERAELELQSAKSNSMIVAHAPLHLKEAEEYLERGKNRWDDNGEEAEADHNVYLIERTLQTAQLVAGREETEAQLSALHEMRDEVRLDARARAALRAEGEARELHRELGALQRELTDLRSKETTRGLEVTLSDVLFEFDRAELKPGAGRKLAPLIEYLRRNPEARARIEGYTDSLGTASYNLRLSQDRADAVRSLLVQNGISPTRVESFGYGEQYPVATNQTAEGRLQNRRVQIVITSGAEPIG